MDASYAALVGHRPARRLLYALATTTLSYGMLSLTVLLTVERCDGLLPDGRLRGRGLGAHGCRLGAVPRPADRPRRRPHLASRAWPPATRPSSSRSTSPRTAALPPWALVLLAAGSGVSAPPIFASARSLWVHVVEPELVRRGYAADVAALRRRPDRRPDRRRRVLPLLLVARAPSSAARSPSAARSSRCRRAGTSTPTSRPRRCRRSARARRSSACSRVSILFGGSQGVVQVAVPAASRPLGPRRRSPAPSSRLFAAGSVTGALWYGTRHLAPLGASTATCAPCSLVGVLLAPAAFAEQPGPARRRPLPHRPRLRPGHRRAVRVARRARARAAAPSR